MKIASAQINCKVGDVQQNLEEHYRIIQVAINNHVRLITFPEMSISGYCREEAEKLAFINNDTRLDKLQELSTNGNIIIVAGAPIKIENNLYIGSFIIFPEKPIRIYTKQYLHDGEEVFFDSSMNYDSIIDLGIEKICLAICADINNKNHPSQAKKDGCTIYLPSIFYSEEGIDIGYKQLAAYAKNFSFSVLMSNYSGELWGVKSGGKSAFWNSKGKLIDNLDSEDTGLLIAENENDTWTIAKIFL